MTPVTELENSTSYLPFGCCSITYPTIPRKTPSASYEFVMSSTRLYRETISYYRVNDESSSQTSNMSTKGLGAQISEIVV